MLTLLTISSLVTIIIIQLIHAGDMEKRVDRLEERLNVREMVSEERFAVRRRNTRL